MLDGALDPTSGLRHLNFATAYFRSRRNFRLIERSVKKSETHGTGPKLLLPVRTVGEQHLRRTVALAAMDGAVAEREL